MTAQNFRDEPGSVFQIGTPPFRIDIRQRVDGISFDEVWQSRLEALVEGEVPAWVRARRHLIKNKLASGRAQDLADLEAMREAEDADDSSGRQQKG